MFLIGVLIGSVVGATCGFFTCSLMVVSARESEWEEGFNEGVVYATNRDKPKP